MGKKWDAFWRGMGSVMDLLPGAVDEMTQEGVTGPYRTVHITNGDVVIRGPIKSLRINGYLVRVPKHVMEGGRG